MTNIATSTTADRQTVSRHQGTRWPITLLHKLLQACFDLLGSRISRAGFDETLDIQHESRGDDFGDYTTKRVFPPVSGHGSATKVIRLFAIK